MDKAKLDTLFDLSGRVAIVTGGTRGIGRAIAEGFVAAGAHVVVASRKADACAQTQTHLESMTGPNGRGQALGVATNMGDLDAISALVAATAERFGRIDIVINNAATALTEPLGGFTPSAYAKVMDVNLRGPVFLAQEALPYLTEAPGASIVNVISAGAFMFAATQAAYSAAKAGLLSFTRSMAGAWAPLDVRVNALAPGTTLTDMVTNNPGPVVESMSTISLLGRFADPDEMVGPTLFLASDASSYVTGQVLLADGGLIPH